MAKGGQARLALGAFNDAVKPNGLRKPDDRQWTKMRARLDGNFSASLAIAKPFQGRLGYRLFPLNRHAVQHKRNNRSAQSGNQYN